MEMKYKNLKELSEAFKSGELSGDDWLLQLDNDNCGLVFVGINPHRYGSIEADKFEESKHEESHALYSGNGYSDLEEAILALDIPCDWC